MDPIADMIVIIKNGYLAKKGEIVVPFSKFKQEIANVLEKERGRHRRLPILIIHQRISF